jgi:hypothetical protein
MKNLKYLFFLLFMSCASSKVYSDYNDKIDFTSYKTYNTFENAGGDLNELDKRRIIFSIDTEMQKLGFIIDKNPDIFIDFKSKISESQSNNTIAIGLGNGNFGLSGGIPIGGKKLLEEVTLDFVTPKKEQLVWQGILTAKIREKRTPEEKEIKYAEIIQKILKEFPPGKK